MTDLDLTRYEGHTPGPWDVWDGPEYVGGGKDLCIGAGEDWLANMDHRVCRSLACHQGICDPEPNTRISSLDAHKDCPCANEEHVTAEQAANARLIADAPLLLAEVRRLRVELDELRDGVEAAGLEYREDDGPASYWRNTPALDAEHELRALRQSHARLMAALKCMCACFDKPLGSRYEECARDDARLAVAEAEAICGE